MTYYPLLCSFPGCSQPAPLTPDEDTDGALCANHERIRFYEPAAFQRMWRELDPER